MKAEAQLAAAREAQTSSKESFQAMAGEALKDASSQFLQLAKTQFEGSAKESTAELDKRKTAIESLVKPLEEKLEALGKVTRELEGSRKQAYGDIQSQLKHLAKTTDSLNTNSTALTTALKGSSQARGRWGETTLRNIVDLAGMANHCDFEEQATDKAGKRPDMVVKLPGNGRIPVDSKVPLKAYLAACEATDPDERKKLHAAHAQAVRTFIKDLSAKDYASQLEGKVDFTVMFLPGEPILAAAFEHDPTLQEYGMQNRVLIVTPATLVALLRTVSIYWDREAMSRDAEELWKAAATLYERVATFQNHLDGVGKGLKDALQKYNDAVGSFERRILPAGKKVEELGGARQSARQIEEGGEVEGTVRQLTGGD